MEIPARIYIRILCNIEHKVYVNQFNQFSLYIASCLSAYSFLKKIIFCKSVKKFLILRFWQCQHLLLQADNTKPLHSISSSVLNLPCDLAMLRCTVEKYKVLCGLQWQWGMILQDHVFLQLNPLSLSVPIMGYSTAVHFNAHYSFWYACIYQRAVLYEWTFRLMQVMEVILSTMKHFDSSRFHFIYPCAYHIISCSLLVPWLS